MAAVLLWCGWDVYHSMSCACEWVWVAASARRYPTQPNETAPAPPCVDVVVHTTGKFIQGSFTYNRFSFRKDQLQPTTVFLGVVSFS
jgi:hypothetical protein